MSGQVRGLLGHPLGALGEHHRLGVLERQLRAPPRLWAGPGSAVCQHWELKQSIYPLSLLLKCELWYLIPKIMPQKTPKLSDLKQCLFSCSRAVGRLRLGWAGLAWTPDSGLWPQRGFESVPGVSHRPGSSSRWGLRSPLHGVPLGPRLKGQGPLRHALKHKRALPHGPWV